MNIICVEEEGLFDSENIKLTFALNFEKYRLKTCRELEMIQKLSLHFWGSFQLEADKIIFIYYIVAYWKFRHRQGTNRKYQ